MSSYSDAVDVVARRRLRASRSQIEQATKAARSKRVEFEATLFSWMLSDMYTPAPRVVEAVAPGSRQAHSNAHRILQLQSQREAGRVIRRPVVPLQDDQRPQPQQEEEQQDVFSPEDMERLVRFFFPFFPFFFLFLINYSFVHI